MRGSTLKVTYPNSPKKVDYGLQHYLGFLTLRQVCAAVGVEYADQPETMPEWIVSLTHFR